MALSDYLLKGSIHRVPYKGRDGRNYIFGIYRHVLDATDTLGTDRLYVMYNDNGLFQIVGKYNFSGKKGGNDFTYDILNGTVFISSSELHQYVNSTSAGTFYFYINESSTFVSGFLTNSPAGDILISAKDRLFVSGKTTSYIYGGDCTLTNGSTVVTPSKQATTNRARADGVATLTLAVTAMQYNWKVGDRIKVTLCGGTGYNTSSAVITAVSGVTISYANSGADEGSTADTAGRVEPDWVNTLRPGDMIMVAVPYSFVIAAATTITTLPVAGDTYTVNSSTFTIIRLNLTAEGSSKYNGTIYCTRSVGTNEPSSSGTLTKATGSGTNIMYTAFTLPNPISVIPGLWSEIKKINDDNSLTLVASYSYYTSLIGAYIIKRVREDVVYHSATDPVSDWNISGQVGGDDSGFFLSKEPVTGLHNYDDAVLIFSKERGYFIEGTTIADWQIPKNTKLPVGCISHKSIVSKNKWLGWLSEKGYFISKGGALNFSDLQGEAYSELIQRTINDIDLTVAKAMYAYVYKQFLFLSVCSTSVYMSEDDDEQIFDVDRITCDTTTISIDNTDSPYSAAATTGNVAINCDTSSGNIAITLPAASGNKAIYKITKTSASNALTISGTGANLIVGVPIYTVTPATAGTNITLFSDGTNWLVTDPYSVIRSSYATTNRARTGYAVTLTIGTHYFVAGDPIYVSGVSGTGYNGTWEITSVAATTVTYDCATNANEASTADAGGTVSPAFVGNVQPNDLLKIGSLYYNITKIIDNTTFIIDELISDQTAAEYTIVKRRNNRLLVLDTRTNVRKTSYGWTVFDNVNVDSFCLLDDELYYASSTTPNIFRYDTGGRLYGAAFTASFTTNKSDCGLKGIIKYFKSLHIKCKGYGRLYITPYVDDVELDQMCIDVNNDYYESFYFPNAINPAAAVDNYPKNCFSGQGETIELYFELTGSDETLAVLPPEIGYIPLSRRMH